MIEVDVDSNLMFWFGIVFGAEGQFHRPFIQAQGRVHIDTVHFMAMSFDSHSCITMTAGDFTIQANYESSIMSSAVNLTTTGNGAFLSAHAASVSLNHTMFVNCSARSGGAVLISDSNSLSVSEIRFVNCSASADGGAPNEAVDYF
ncbi:hypothetical protein BLNAU_3327 [Blattamonas nauphoetae]|uniref:Dispersed gene family protein 1 (DGF-1) n=1 Tax=Blattamonas nauphoetae TaxID=2049346 RepID=A0ABQ9YDU4_9EUKA|nr:hypothetical protein BLNAU_3327 [Blattamonas nauphoetae]